MRVYHYTNTSPIVNIELFTDGCGMQETSVITDIQGLDAKGMEKGFNFKVGVEITDLELKNFATSAGLDLAVYEGQKQIYPIV